MLISFVLFFSPSPVAYGQTAVNAITPLTIRTDATFNHIGVRWEVSGDENLNSSMSLEFRPVGETTWREAAPAMRAYPTIRVDGAPLGLNYWAASALFLGQGQTYELRLTLTDPDGGDSSEIVTATTRMPLQPAENGRSLTVIPGNGGGNGSTTNPFQGLQAAAAAAQPGDTFTIMPGTYAPFQLLTSGTDEQPITFLGDGQTVIIDGNNIETGIITLGNFDQTLSHLILQGLTIQNGAWGIDAQHTNNIHISHNTIQDVVFGVANRREANSEFNQTVCDNTIRGRSVWPGDAVLYEQGIDLRGTGNVVCHNVVQNFADCISVLGQSGATFGNDIFGNDVSHCIDDGIEIDYNESNSRVWRNRVYNARMGVSLQPLRGGPAYIFRNEFFNIDFEPIKMNNDPTGFFIIHNTGVKHANGFSDAASSQWRNAVLRNNLFLGTRYAFEFQTIAEEGFRDLDYNAWGTSREIDGPDAPYFKWNNERYGRLSDLQAIGIEPNGVEVTFADLVNGTLPPSYTTAVSPDSRDLRLVAGGTAVNAGTPLPNLNDAFAIDGLPDAGAFELGQPLPQYGPRFPDPTHQTADNTPAARENDARSTGEEPTPGALIEQETAVSPSQPATRQLPFLIFFAMLLTAGGLFYGWWLGQRPHN
ncbi:MAG: hypothetical protein AAF614_23020 [Chloroflexota bacterium]